MIKIEKDFYLNRWGYITFFVIEWDYENEEDIKGIYVIITIIGIKITIFFPKKDKNNGI